VDSGFLSIASLANQLQVSRQTIYNKLDELEGELKEYIIVEKNIKYLKTEAIDIIKDSIKFQPNKLNHNIKNDLKSEYKEALEGFKELQVNYISGLLDQIKQLKNQVDEKNDQLVKNDKQLIVKDNQISEKDRQISEKDKQLNIKDKQLNNKDELLRNFQILLKSEQQNIKLLQEKNSRSIWSKIFGDKKESK
jgi:transcriptional antiterminator